MRPKRRARLTLADISTASKLAEAGGGKPMGDTAATPDGGVWLESAVKRRWRLARESLEKEREWVEGMKLPL